MSDLMARISAITSVVLAIAAGVVLYVTSQPGLDGTAVQAEFEDAYPLLEGMHVREYGAVAGTVSEIEVTDRGTALITMQLHEGTDPPRADATATIRQEDITGDSYVSLSPGDDPEPLGDETIAMQRTMSAPRFDDLLNSFNEPVRQGLELTLVELGKTLEARGEDLNEAALRLRPAFAAANEALTEVNSQNASLRALVADAHRVTGQAADRSRELGQLVDSLATTLATTAAHGQALDAGLDNLPETLDATERTLARLSRFADASRPLAVSLGRMAPDLAEAATLLGPFLDDAEAILDDVEPTLDLTARLLAASEPTLEANPKRVFTAPFDVASGIADLLDTLIGDPDLMRSLFGADTYGGTKPGDFSDDVGLGSIAVERGTQAGYPSDYDPLRRFVRASAVPSCETFGVPIEPGCLSEILSGLRARGDQGAGGGTGPGGGDGSGPGPSAGGGGGGGPGGGGGLGDALGQLGDDLDLDETLDDVGDAVGGLGDTVGGLTDGLAPRRGGRSTRPPRGPGPGEVDTLLDFLTKP
jgi:virulence factor Mce-like protein